MWLLHASDFLRETCFCRSTNRSQINRSLALLVNISRFLTGNPKLSCLSPPGLFVLADGSLQASAVCERRGSHRECRLLL